MTFAAAQTAIENRLATGFTAYPIKYQNVDFDPEAQDTYVELQIKEDETFRASIGDNLHRTLGVISTNVYTTKNVGTVAARAIADDLAAVFRDQRFSGITCRSPSVTNIGPYEGRYVVNMTVPFFRDEHF